GASARSHPSLHLRRGDATGENRGRSQPATAFAPLSTRLHGTAARDSGVGELQPNRSDYGADAGHPRKVRCAGATGQRGVDCETDSGRKARPARTRESLVSHGPDRRNKQGDTRISLVACRLKSKARNRKGISPFSGQRQPPSTVSKRCKSTCTPCTLLSRCVHVRARCLTV